MFNKHIILDIDGTLIAENNLYEEKNGRLIPRPYLDEFLTFCFANFQSVSIWTAASHEWYDIVYDKILKEKTNEFRFVFTGERCSYKINDEELNNGNIYALRYVIKPLRKVWRKFGGEITRKNTLILDNTPRTYVLNYGNGIPIKTYTGDQDDNELLKLMRWLKTILQSEDVRVIEKRFWSKRTHLIVH